MKTILRLIATWIIAFLFHPAYAQDLSNKGKDFWIGYGNHVRMFSNQPSEKMELYITSDVSTTGQVTIASIGFTQNFTVTANQITTISIPRTAALSDDGLYNHGIHVTANSPVVVYSFIFVNAISGATVCLPTNTLGRDYFSVNFDQTSNDPDSHSYFFVIAADTGTTSVEITPSSMTKSGRPAGVPFTVNLTQGQVYQVLGRISGSSGVDLTGSRIRSINAGSGCKRIAVYSGSGKISIGCSGVSTADNLYQQMYPTSTWGKKYITVPSAVNSTNYYRIVKSNATAVVKVNGTVIPPGSFTNDFYYQYSSSQPDVIEADQPIMVAQYFTTEGCSGNNAPGDPEMIFLNPVEQTVSTVTLNSMQPAGIAVNQHYLNILIKNSPSAINSLRIDGAPYSSFTPVPGDAGYAYARINTSAGTHNITCDSGFNIIAYGFGSRESYGYSGGTNLRDLYQFASIKNEYATVNFPATCVNAPFRFSMTFPYQPTRIQWKFGGLYADETINTPVPDSSWQLNGKQLYLYRLPKTYIGPAVGSYPIRILANNPTTDGCTGEQEIDFDLKVFAKPVASFDFVTTACLKDTVRFTEAYSATGDRAVIQWQWNFGTGDLSADRNPKYLYKDTGRYKASFSLITDIGCLSDTAVKTIKVNPLPTAGFVTNLPYCSGSDLLFTDTSSAGNDRIAEWKWTIDNGQPVIKTSGDAFSYRFNNAGTYQVSLQTKTANGCSSEAFTKSIIVHPTPVAGFILPENCLQDPFSQFTDTSKIADGSEAQFTYLWNFGDRNASAGNENLATSKTPKHKYTATGPYNIRLQVTSKNGCIDSEQQTFFINGSSPNTAFSFVEGLQFCSNDTLTLINQSSADVGSIVKLEILWDEVNDPANKLVDDNPTPGKKYSIRYPEFYNPSTTDYKIKVLAYSGQTCVSSVTEIVQAKQTPQLAFDALAAVCSNAPSFAISGTSIVNGLNGAGVFSGRGITASGSFNPSLAQGGKDSIVYTYTATNGCTNSIGRTIQVHTAPTVNAGADEFLIKGRSKILKATSTGSNLSYAWTPATGLDNSSILQPNASPMQDITYSLTATSPEGCLATDAVAITVYDQLFIPNAFTPNNDGKNDLWRLWAIDPSMGAEVSIFNRNGNRVYYAKGTAVNWDGTVNGQPQPAGAYVYLIDFKNGEPVMKGTLMLIL